MLMFRQEHRRLAAAVFSVLVGIAVAACGGDDGEAFGEGESLDVVATSGIVADIVGTVGGDDVEVIQIVPDGSNPHFYEASARDRRAMDEADLVVYFGEGLEENLPFDDLETQMVAINDHVGELRELTGQEDLDGHDRGQEGDERGHDHGPGSKDPHVWMDPLRVQRAVPVLAAELGEVDPENAEDYRQRATRYAERLGALDEQIEAMVASIPAGERQLVTSHESMAYFADRYGFELLGAPFGLTPEAEAGARTIARLIEVVQENEVPAVFAQEGDDPRVLRQIAEATGVEVVDDLLVESLGPQGETYVEALGHTAKRIAETLDR